MSRSFALEYGEFGIRVNTVLPGVIQTCLLDAYDAATLQRFIQKSPLRRLGLPEDIGHAVLYLSAASGGFVTGVALPVDGGMTVTVF